MVQRRPIVVVTGRRCAGKSTVGQLVREDGGMWIEASFELANLRTQNPHCSPERLWRAVEDGIVGSLAYQKIVKIGENAPLTVVTGLRYRSELNMLDIDSSLSVVNLTASSAVRYQRNIERARKDQILSWSDWEQSERQDDQFDLLNRPTGHFFHNEGALVDLRDLVQGFANGSFRGLASLSAAEQ